MTVTSHIDPDADWEMIALAQAGRMDAFEALVRRYQKPVAHFCFRMLGNREDAEEVAQEAFVRVYRYLDRLHPSAKFSTVLFGMARNLALNAIRDAGRRGRNTTTSLDAWAESAGDDRALRDPQPAPDEAARLAEMRGGIEACLEKLSPEHKEALLLREMQGMDYDTIAGITGVPKGTIKSRIARAREQLRKLLDLAGGREL